MAPDANPPVEAPEDAAALVEAAGRLADAVESTLPGWVERCVRRVVDASLGGVPPSTPERAAAEGRRAAEEVGVELRRLLATDVDRQWTNPLTVLRDAVRFPTGVLRDAGVPPVPRDEFDARHFPDDDYGLTPMSFGDVDPALQEPGIVWGAMKARVHLARHGHKRSAEERR